MIAVVIWLLAMIHPFHVSVCEVVWKEESSALQLTYRVFLDDMEMALRRETGNQELNIVTDSLQVHQAMRTYFHQTFHLELNGKKIDYRYLGGEIEEDVMWCYLEVEGVDKVNSLKITSTHLTEVYDDQQNIIHFKIGGEKKSYILTKRETEAVFD